MPEGHTLHRLAQDHTTWFAGQTLSLSSPQGRFSEGARILDQCTLLRAEAVGKHLLYVFAEGVIHVHLGLFGKFKSFRTVPDPKSSVRLRIRGRDRVLDLTGPTDCSVWSDEQVTALRARLGPDPLDPDADPERFFAGLRKRKRAIGAVLLDQKVVSGIGNVYRAELLFLAALDPHTPCKELSQDQMEALWANMVRLLAIGVRTNRIITTEPGDFGKTLSKMARHESVWVYKRRSCRRCSESIEVSELGNRTLYHCPSCQS